MHCSEYDNLGTLVTCRTLLLIGPGAAPHGPWLALVGAKLWITAQVNSPAPLKNPLAASNVPHDGWSAYNTESTSHEYIVADTAHFHFQSEQCCFIFYVFRHNLIIELDEKRPSSRHKKHSQVLEIGDLMKVIHIHP